MYNVSAQGIDERMINVHYYYYVICKQLCWASSRGGSKCYEESTDITNLPIVT